MQTRFLRRANAEHSHLLMHVFYLVRSVTEVLYKTRVQRLTRLALHVHGMGQLVLKGTGNALSSLFCKQRVPVEISAASLLGPLTFGHDEFWLWTVLCLVGCLGASLASARRWCTSPQE